jgi:hypothetical protein
LISSLIVQLSTTGYINEGYGGKAGYYFSSTCVLIGSAALSLIDVHRRRVARHKHTAANGKQHTCIIENCPDRSVLNLNCLLILMSDDKDKIIGANYFYLLHFIFCIFKVAITVAFLLVAFNCLRLLNKEN